MCSIVKVLDSYGPLAVLIYIRVEKVARDELEWFDLGMLGATTDGLKFFQRVLSFFNYNLRQAKKNQKARQKIDRLLKMVPSIKELRKALKEN